MGKHAAVREARQQVGIYESEPVRPFPHKFNTLGMLAVALAASASVFSWEARQIRYDLNPNIEQGLNGAGLSGEATAPSWQAYVRTPPTEGAASNPDFSHLHPPPTLPAPTEVPRHVRHEMHHYVVLCGEGKVKC